ncbi:Metal-pseudopaline receptor CntO [Pseudoalteromonas sp. CIP111854]|uniref:Metal-pseudopaline receptor CntO n=1 Tax=Pseudoalteromonas holothuriae TaxID=2963714 RepID=A0A9W4W178_9GAMM|nr:TonB-dependent receptor [Pseudoalteromonas sp. CIP111854]CAH9061891.1 Metal-pseudopaline receptor CntO [Pseudoalteromonas sp. CIP111854]
MKQPYTTALFKKSFIVMAVASALSPTLSVAQTSQDSDIEVITVKGRAAQFYFVEQATMATKTPTDYMDLPQSVQVLSKQLIQDQAARQTTDLYRSISGVTQFSYSGITARGFRQDQVRYDGVQGDPYSGFSIPQLFNVERVEVLKGPTGMLYGAGQPGGLLNYVSKKPKFEQTTQMALFAGNDDLLGGHLETTGTLSEDVLAYRVAGFHQNKNSYRNNVEEANTLLSAGITWYANDKTELIFQYDHIDQALDGHRLRGVPVDDNGHFLTNISYNANEKSDFQNLKADVFQLTANFDIANNLSNTTVIRGFSNERAQQYHENLGLIADLSEGQKEQYLPVLDMLGMATQDTAMMRQFRDQNRENEEWSVTTDFVYEGTFAGTEHMILFGADYAEVEQEFENKVSDLTRTLNPANYADPREIFNPENHVPTLDIINPLYNADTSKYKRINAAVRKSKSQRQGLYLQDQIRLTEQWLAIAGLRYDRFEDQEGIKVVNDNKLSPRIGAIYQPNENMSLFVNRSEGFSPQSLSQQPESGEIFGPETSTQHEFGLRNIWLDGNLTTTFTTYHIVKNDVAVSNPNYVEGNGLPEQLQIGEVTSKGVELDIIGDIADDLTGTISYAYNDATITGGNPKDISNTVGKEFANAPDHTLGMWARYALPTLNSSISLGFDYVDERVSLSGQTVRSYVTWDASWQTQIDNFEIQLNLKNIFDKEYATSGFNKRNGHFPGEPRSVVLQVSYAL